VVVAGPTASGKTALACALAERLDAEVVSADSQQCYRGLDAGTAKPGAEELARAPHHLLSIAEPEEQLDAAAFVRLADAAIADIRSRGRNVLVVGGTGFWIRALLRGLVAAPGADAGFRARFREEVAESGVAALHARLAEVDAGSAARIGLSDRVRIERALEVHALTGQTLSELQRAHRFQAPRYPARILLLDPPRELLAARIGARTRALFSPEEGGEGPLLRETRALLARIDRIPAAAKALKIIGYGETAAALRRESAGQEPSSARGAAAPEALREAEETTALRTRQYARRQRTWFRKDAPALDALGSPVPATSAEDAGGLFPALRQWYEAAG
jgi:tRNA dimethylallyltransferase